MFIFLYSAVSNMIYISKINQGVRGAPQKPAETPFGGTKTLFTGAAGTHHKIGLFASITVAHVP